MKRLIIFFTAITCLVATATGKEKIGDLYYNLNSDNKTAEVTPFSNFSEDNRYYVSGTVVIPEKIVYQDIEYTVNSIGDRAFRGCTGLTSVEIPNSVTSIGSGAFEKCPIESLKIDCPNIESWFVSNRTLKNLTIGNSVTSIGERAFNSCTALTSVTIGNSVTSIGDFAFYKCSGLTSLEIPNSVTSIGNWAFDECPIESLKIDCTNIGDWFSGNTTLKNLIIGDSVISIGNDAFWRCTGLTSIEIPNSVTEIGYWAFCSCSGLTSVEIGNSVTSIGNLAFEECPIESLKIDCPNIERWFSDKSTLKNLIIGNSVTSIGNYAFSGCSGLTSVEIGNSVISIGEYAFENCTGLTKVEISDLEAWCKITFSTLLSNPLYYAKHLYLNGEEVKDLIIPNSVTTIGVYAFAGWDGLTSVEIPNSVTEIGQDAFYGCTSLTKVEISDLEAWNKIKFSDNVSNPLYYAHHLYLNGEEVIDLVIPDSITEIGDYAFAGWFGLTSLEIPDSVISIGASAFYGCTGLTNVVIPNSVTEIRSSAFYGCAELKSLIFKSLQILTLGSEAFNNCGNIATIQCNTNRPPVSADYSVFDEEVYSNCKLYVPDAQKSLYYTVIPWSKFQNIYSTDYIPGEEENVYKIVPVLSLSQTLTLGVKNTETNSLEETFQWNSSDVYVAEVDSQGVVTAKSVGDAIISATNSDGESATFEIIVIDGDDDTDVSEILLESERNRNVYTLGGLIVIREATQEDLRTLAPGLYIIGGKKVLVK